MQTQDTVSKQTITNLRYSARIVRRVYGNPFCNISFIGKGNGIPRNTNTLRKLINELLSTGYFHSTYVWGKECFYVDRFSDPVDLYSKTFWTINHSMSHYLDNHPYLLNTKPFQKFLKKLHTKSLVEATKDNFKTKPMTYPKKLDKDTDIREVMLQKLLCIYHEKMLLFIRDQDYETKNTDTYVMTDPDSRMMRITEFILLHVAKFADKIEQNDESEFKRYAEKIIPALRI